MNSALYSLEVGVVAGLRIREVTFQTYTFLFTSTVTQITYSVLNL